MSCLQYKESYGTVAKWYFPYCWALTLLVDCWRCMPYPYTCLIAVTYVTGYAWTIVWSGWFVILCDCMYFTDNVADFMFRRVRGSIRSQRAFLDGRGNALSVTSCSYSLSLINWYLLNVLIAPWPGRGTKLPTLFTAPLDRSDFTDETFKPLFVRTWSAARTVSWPAGARPSRPSVCLPG